MTEDNKTIAANICREHAKNYGGPSTPAITVSAIVSELDRRDREIEILSEKTKLVDQYANAAYIELAALKAQIQEAHKDTFDAAFRENDFKERFYAECKETEALKSKLGEAEKMAEKLSVCVSVEFANETAKEFLSSLRSTTKGNLSTASDGEGK